MSNNKSKQSSPQKLAANRRNAQKSTGPRTPHAARTRAWQRQSRYVKSLSYDQAKLGQNPEDFQEFLADLMADWRPQGAMEMTLVEDLATLEMERRLVDRAQRGRLVARLEREEADVSRTARRLDEDATPTATREEVAANGLRNAPDSSGKFRQLMELLEGLLAVVKIGDFSCPAGEIFTTLYGEHPSWRAAQIISSYKHFVESYAEAPHCFPKLIQGTLPRNSSAAAPAVPAGLDAGEDQLISPDGPRPWGGPARGEDGPPSAAENEYRTLRLLILEEYDAVVSDYLDFIRDRADLSRARRDALLAPCGTRSALMIRQKNSIDRHIERKTKLLLLLQKERRARQAEPLDGPAIKPRHGGAAGRNARHQSTRQPGFNPSHPTASLPKAKCRAAHPRAAVRRARRPIASPSLNPPASSAFRRSLAVLFQILLRRDGTSSRSIVTSTLFFLLGAFLSRLPLTIPASFGAAALPGASLMSPAWTGARPLKKEVTHMREAKKTHALARIVRIKPSNTRDVFLPYESHQILENKQSAPLSKPKQRLVAVKSSLPGVLRPAALKIDWRSEPISGFHFYPFCCDAFETVTLAA
jgi:hypothetical protein